LPRCPCFGLSLDPVAVVADGLKVGQVVIVTASDVVDFGCRACASRERELAGAVVAA
jgi:hypothetical protein